MDGWMDEWNWILGYGMYMGVGYNMFDEQILIKMELLIGF